MKAAAGPRGQFGAYAGRSDRTITCGPTTWREAVPYVQAAFDAGCRRFRSSDLPRLDITVEAFADGPPGRWHIEMHDAEVPDIAEHHVRTWTPAEVAEALTFFGFTVAAG